MPNYESVLTQALELADDERELLMVKLGLSLPTHRSVDEQAFIAELEAISREADANPDSLLEWHESDSEIVGAPPNA